MSLLIIATVFSGGHILFLSGEHLLLVLAAVVFLFGGKKIPEMMGGIGKGMKEFKKAMKDEEAPAEVKKEEPKEVTATGIKDSAAELKA